MSNDTTVNVKINASDQSKAAVEQAKSGFSGLWKSIGGGVIAANLAFAAMDKLKEGIHAVADQVKEHQQVEAQLNSVLQSTHGAAGITAEAVNNLATEISKTTPIDDEAAIAAENMLLTFTSIHKDTFPAATKAVTDMATAMNGGATPSAEQLRDTAIQVGKALNDPITGVTTLRRVGVQLTNQQQDQVKHFMAINDQASAQKIILGELSKEFGGSAAAAADTWSGKLQMMRNHLVNMAADAVPKAEKALNSFIDKAIEFGKAHGAVEVLHGIGDAAKDAWGGLQLLVTGDFHKGLFAKDITEDSTVVKVILGIRDAIQNSIGIIMLLFTGDFKRGLFSKNITEDSKIIEFIIKLRSVIVDLAGRINTVVKQAWTVLKKAIDLLMPSLKALFTAIEVNMLPPLKEMWTSLVRLYNALQPALMDVLKVLAIIIGVTLFAAIWVFINVLRIGVEVMATVAKAIAEVIGWVANLIGWFGTALVKIGDFIANVIYWFKGLPGTIQNAVSNFGSLLYNAGKDLIQGLINGVKDMAGSAVNAVKGVGSSAVSGLKSVLGIHSPSIVFAGIGQNMGLGLMKGLDDIKAQTNVAVSGLVTGSPLMSGRPIPTTQNSNTTNTSNNFGGNTQSVTIQNLVMPPGSTLKDIFQGINQDNINISKGLSAVQGSH